MSRAQSGVEFIIIFSFIFLTFLVFFAVLERRTFEQQAINSELRYRQVADVVEQELMLAARVATGYRREFSLPRDLDGEPYNITLTDGDTLIVTGNWTKIEHLRFLSINATLVPATSSSILVPQKLSVILQRNASGIYLRKDCVQAGKTAEQCV